ncbi:MAG: OmpA family protein [Azoarcus sp.]|jgi:OOP family OmpA-OmpF porin|nr:OmpA family protein [Azoarcus sp.]
MTIRNQKLLMLAAIASIGLSASTAFAQADVVVDGKGDEVPYAIDARNVVTRSGAGLCWRTGYWTPAAAGSAQAGQFPVGCSCDSDIVPKEKCEPPKPVVTAPPETPPVVTPQPPVQVETPKVQLNADFLFDFNSAVLKPVGREALDDIAAQASQLQLEVVLVTGHSDRLGSDSYNLRISERRALAVKDHLVSKGIEASRIYTEGKGKSAPVTGTQCNNIRARQALIACLQPDRRVDVEIIGTR